MKRVLKTLSFALAVLLAVSVVPMGAFQLAAHAETSGIFTYTVTDGKATITGCDTAATGEIVIPDTIEGYPVTSIGDYAFSSCRSLTSVIIPDSVTSIGEHAFDSCSITSVTIGDGVTNIGLCAFKWCGGLTDITVSDNNANYLSLDGVLYNKDKTELICCPAGKKGSFTIPDSVTSIGDFAFYWCRPLTSITIPDSVTSIGDYAFSWCYSLISITIPDSVTSIGDCAFSWCYSLISITIPDSVTSIGDGVFEGCYSLTSVTIPDSVTSIGDYVFQDCNALTDVYFIGNEEEWNTVSIGNYNEALANATIHFVPCYYGHSFVNDICEICGEERVLPKFSSASLTLKDNININFKVDVDTFTELGYKNPSVKFLMNGETFVVTSYETVYGKYVFELPDIAPQQMLDTVYATVYGEDGDEVIEGETIEYSIATYARNMLNTTAAAPDTYKKLRILLVDMINYGTAAQEYMGYKTDNLVSSILSDDEKALGTVAVPEVNKYTNTKHAVIDNPTAKWKSAGLNLTDSITMRFRIQLTGDTALEDIKVKVVGENGGEWTVTSDTFVSDGVGGYYLYFNGFTPSQMREKVYLTVYCADEAISNTLCYSVESYAAAKQNDSNTKLVELLNAMMRYGDSAKTYWG